MRAFLFLRLERATRGIQQQPIAASLRGQLCDLIRELRMLDAPLLRPLAIGFRHQLAHTIRADLSFNEAGELTNFWSDDRYQTSPDGKSVKKVRWSTPLLGYRSCGPIRLTSGGEARWHESSGDYAYIELTLDDVQYNVPSR